MFISSVDPAAISSTGLFHLYLYSLSLARPKYGWIWNQHRPIAARKQTCRHTLYLAILYSCRLHRRHENRLVACDLAACNGRPGRRHVAARDHAARKGLLLTGFLEVNVTLLLAPSADKLRSFACHDPPRRRRPGGARRVRALWCSCQCDCLCYEARHRVGRQGRPAQTQPGAPGSCQCDCLFYGEARLRVGRPGRPAQTQPGAAWSKPRSAATSSQLGLEFKLDRALPGLAWRTGVSGP